MKTFRFAVPAHLFFSVRAETEEEAVALAERIRCEANDCDVNANVDLGLDGEPLPDYADAYFWATNDNVNLSADAIQDVSNLICIHHEGTNTLIAGPFENQHDAFAALEEFAAEGRRDLYSTDGEVDIHYIDDHGVVLSGG